MDTENQETMPQAESLPAEEQGDVTKLTRQQRRQMAREDAKKKYAPAPTTGPGRPVTAEDLNNLAADLRRVLNYVKLVDNHVWMLVETLSRKGMLGWADVNETEQLYLKKEERKQQKVKELLEQGLSTLEYLDAIKEGSDVPGWERLDINPIRDLNLNPFEVAAVLREYHPEMAVEEIQAHYKVWGLTAEHFGIKQDQAPAV